MRRDAETHAGAAQRRDVGRVQIALAEMDEIAARVDREAPIVIDDELRPMLRTNSPRGGDLGAQLGLWLRSFTRNCTSLTPSGSSRASQSTSSTMR